MTISSELDVVGVGNALVDVLTHTDDAFIAEQEAASGMKRGTMNLIDERRAVELYGLMGQGTEVSGGSAANTLAGLASFGGKGGFIGKVADDQLGQVFTHDMRTNGTVYRTQPLILGPKTGRCLILVTPDAERTMNTYLGAAVELCPADIDEDLIGSGRVTYLEGYLFDKPAAKDAFREAGKIAHDAGRKVSLTLSDPFCVERHRADFLNLVHGHTDILFANEDEIKSLFKVGDFDAAVRLVAKACETAVLTRSEKGAVIVHNEQIYEIPAEPVARVVDTTGAGDQFAAGFLFGYTRNMPADVCGRLGARAAAEIISHIGPRPEISYATLVD